jgi:hypothetical protein
MRLEWSCRSPQSLNDEVQTIQKTGLINNTSTVQRTVIVLGGVDTRTVFPP